MLSQRLLAFTRTAATVLLAAAVCVCCVAPASADVLTSPLCGEVRGFAGELKDHIHIPIGAEISGQEALVLVARSFPLELGFLTQGWLQINAGYQLTAGASANRTSDENGILVLTNVAMGTEVEVRINRLRRDGPVPFRFFSMIANSHSCFVTVSPDNSFYAPLPRQIHAVDSRGVVALRSATYFFRTPLSTTNNAVTVSITAESDGTQQFNALASDGKQWEKHASGDILSSTTPGDTLLYSFTPEATGQRPYVLAKVSVENADYRGGPTSAPPATGSSVSPASPGGPAIPTPQKQRGSALWSVVKSFLTIVFVAFALAVGLGTFYNVRVRHIHDFPEMVPFHEYFAAFARGVQLCFRRATGRRVSRMGGEYDPVDERDYYR